METFPRVGSVSVSGAFASLHVVGTRLHTCIPYPARVLLMRS